MHLIASSPISLVCLILLASNVNGSVPENQTLPEEISTSEGPEPANLNVIETLKKFVIKFYQKRYLQGQNEVVAPLLVFYVLISLYKVADASTQFDLHSLAEIPHNVPEETMREFENVSQNFLQQATSKRSRIVARLYFNHSIGKIDSGLKEKKFTTTPINFSDKQQFLNHVNSWMQSEYLRSSDNLVHDYDVSETTKAFLVGAFSFDWPSHLKLSSDVKDFQGNKIKYLEGNVRTLYKNITDLNIDVIQLKHGELTRIKFWLILPHPQSSVKDFSEKLNVDTISKIENELNNSMASIALSVPQVIIEYNSQEDSYLMDVFKVFTSLFKAPSVRLGQTKKEKYQIKNFLMKCILRLNETADDVISTAPPADEQFKQKLTLDRPFVMIMLTNDGMPLLLANYFSTRDVLRELEQKVRRLRVQAENERRDDL